MRIQRRLFSTLLIISLGPACIHLASAADDPLPSWNDGPAKRAIVAFVTRVTTPGGTDFVPESERIATFDNDGTLWAEQPTYFQFIFALDRVKALAPQHPEWKDQEPFKSLLAGDLKGVLAGGEPAIVHLMMASHAGMTTAEFEQIVKDWVATARHPRFNRPYTELIYQPMLELLAYVRANGFKTYIVSGGGVEFMRAWTEQVYGIPPEQVVGSTIKTKFERRDGQPVLMRLPEVDFIDDKAGKPVGINKFIGRRPILAFGNSDGDHQMLQWTAAGSGPRFMGLVHHTDAEREWAYDRHSPVGQLDKALDEALAKGWTIVSMKDDWKTIFPPPATGASSDAFSLRERDRETATMSAQQAIWAIWLLVLATLRPCAATSPPPVLSPLERKGWVVMEALQESMLGGATHWDGAALADALRRARR
jgi:phosphoglycolate phosphatase-like HAD superfamily hydrolase